MEKASAALRPMFAELYYEAKQRWREAKEAFRREEFALGVMINHLGIDAAALIQRNIAKARATVWAFVRMGFRADGLLERS